MLTSFRQKTILSGEKNQYPLKRRREGNFSNNLYEAVLGKVLLKYKLECYENIQRKIKLNEVVRYLIKTLPIMGLINTFLGHSTV